MLAPHKPLPLDQFMGEDAELNAGFVQTFDVRIGAAVSDNIDDFESMVVGDLSGQTTEEALMRCAAARYGWAGRSAVVDLFIGEFTAPR
jgi:hypothetical protein